MAAGHGETVLLERVCRGSECHAVFHICPHCDRGHCYCSPVCRQQARRQQCRRANALHQQSLPGREDHRDRQREYRRRIAHENSRVTYHGSLLAASPPSCEYAVPEAKPIAAEYPSHHLCCLLCGRSGYVGSYWPPVPRRNCRTR